MVKNIKWLLIASLSLVACNNDDTVEEQPVTAGSADFSKYVALGDSFAAGYSDGALFKKGQENAYPNIIAQQLMAAGGGTFKTPFMNDNVGGFLPSTLGQGARISLTGFLPDGSPVILPNSGSITTPLLPALTGGFNNLGVPGAKSFHLLAPGYGNPGGLPASANPYFVHFASSTSTSVLADALSQNPTFFSLWIGGNDVLGYATTGGDGTNPITPSATFDGAYNALASQLAAGGKKGVVANLPYINTLPYFTVVPLKPLNPYVFFDDGDALSPTHTVSAGDIAKINLINTQLYGPLKTILTGLGAGNRIQLLSTTQPNPVLITDETLVDYSAQITAALTPTYGAPTATFIGNTFGRARQTVKLANGTTDYILLSSKSAIGAAAPGPAPFNAYGITYPLGDKYVLIPSEIDAIKTATDSFNATIATAANANGLALVDAKSIMNELLNGGIRFGNYHMTASYITGGTFSLDGIHPSARGYALIANKFIEAINAKYGSTVRTVDPGNYQPLYPPSL